MSLINATSIDDNDQNITIKYEVKVENIDIEYDNNEEYDFDHTDDMFEEECQDVKDIILDCKNIDTSLNDLKETQEQEEKDEQCACPYCHKLFAKEITFVQHLEMHFKKHMCRICTMSFKFTDGLLKHIRKAHNDSSEFKCKQNKNKAGFVQQDFKCENCGQLFKLKEELQLHSDKCGEAFGKEFECNECGKVFKSSGYLIRHMRSHGKTFNFKCDKCKKEFRQGDTLINHMKIHSDTNIFECDKCGKTFKYKQYLRQHMYIHNDTLQCNKCKKTFLLKRQLIKHMLTHCCSNDYKCDKCGKTFCYKSGLIMHVHIYCDTKVMT